MDLSKYIMEPLLDMEQFYRDAEDYYEGNVQEVWTSNRLRKTMRPIFQGSLMNFLRPVVDVVNDRLEINNIVAESVTAKKLIDKVRKENDMQFEEAEIHRRALIYGEAYAMVWPDEDGNWLISYHSPKDTIVGYDPANPRKKLYGAHIWYDYIKEVHRMELFTKDEVVKYWADTKELSMGVKWIEASREENPFGEVPFFHFKTRKPYGRPEHLDGYRIQDSINKLATTHLVTVDYQGAPQRWALESDSDTSEIDDFTEGETDREQPNSLQASPGEMWLLKNIKSVGQFDAAKPEIFWNPIRDNVSSLAAITETPLHYFQATGNVPSGNALRAAEAPMLKKVEERRHSFGATWRELYQFIIKAELGKSELVEVLWRSVESLDALEQWDIMAKKINVGVSLKQVLREAGYDDDTIEDIVKEKIEQNEWLNYQRAANTNPEVRTNTNKDETKISDTNGGNN